MDYDLNEVISFSSLNMIPEWTTCGHWGFVLVIFLTIYLGGVWQGCYI